MRYEVKDLVGEYGITLDDGQRIYDLIHSHLLDGERVELDFSGVEVLASPFFNAAIGQLLKDISSEQLNRLLVVSNLVPAGMRALRRVIENSKQYYSNPRFRQALDEVLAEQIEG